jgi:succinate dehydrogenase/fumarate reductase flavoprotein subunit
LVTHTTTDLLRRKSVGGKERHDEIRKRHDRPSVELAAMDGGANPMSRGFYDVVVVGSGGAALVAACAAADRGLSVTVLESTELIGGTTALSGGQMWIPGSPAMSRSGLEDSADGALQYLRRLSLGTTPEATLQSFVVNAPRFVDYLENELEMPVVSIDRPDYHPDWDGAAWGRSVEPLPVTTDELGEWRHRVRTSPTRGPVTGPESRTGVVESVLRERTAADLRTQGSGLVAGLVKAALRRGVDLQVQAGVRSVQRRGDHFVLHTAKGQISATNVVLAAGGFARNATLRSAFLPPIAIVPTAAPGSQGDGLRLGTSLGGTLRGMSEAWWTAAVSIAGESIDSVPLHRNVVRELAYPGSILVNAAGNRFVNEASSYNDLGKAFFAFDPTNHRFPNQPAWLVFDSAFRSRRTIAGVGPDASLPDEFIRAADLKSLAQQTGIDPDGLAATVADMNRMAEAGTDLQFGRGQSAHDQFNGDEAHHPNPCLGAIAQGPFFAVPVVLGANGTKGGLVTDHVSRVLDHDGTPIDGLFAVGENAAALMGPGYAGSGASLGPALTAAFTLAEHLGQRGDAALNDRDSNNSKAPQATRS